MAQTETIRSFTDGKGMKWNTKLRPHPDGKRVSALAKADYNPYWGRIGNFATTDLAQAALDEFQKAVLSGR